MVPLAIEWAWPETPASIAITIVAAVAGRWLLLRAIKRGSELAVSRANQRRVDQGGDNAELYAARHAARAATMGSLLRSVTNVTIAVLTVLTVMAILNIPLTPILASAGVGGVALGFGAQSLVKDFLSGIFMIMEDQYGVGDTIDTGQVTGTVEEVGLRVTRLRDSNGQVWYVRNGEIVKIGNASQGWSTATVDVPIAWNADAARAIEVLDGVVKAVFDDPRWEGVLLEEPSVAGVDSVSGGTAIIKIFAKCAPNQQWGVQRDLLERGTAALREAGVPGPVLGPFGAPKA